MWTWYVYSCCVFSNLLLHLPRCKFCTVSSASGGPYQYVWWGNHFDNNHIRIFHLDFWMCWCLVSMWYSNPALEDDVWLHFSQLTTSGEILLYFLFSCLDRFTLSCASKLHLSHLNCLLSWWIFIGPRYTWGPIYGSESL